MTTAKNTDMVNLQDLGISKAELEAILAQRRANTPTLIVQANEGDERKFGVVSLIKVHPNGFRKPFGLTTEDMVDEAIAGLQAYRAANPR